MEVGTFIQCQEKFSRLFKNAGHRYVCEVVETKDEYVLVKRYFDVEESKKCSDDELYSIKTERLNKFDVLDEDKMAGINDLILLNGSSIKYKSITLNSVQEKIFHKKILERVYLTTDENLYNRNATSVYEITDEDRDMFGMLLTPTEEQEALTTRCKGALALVTSTGSEGFRDRTYKYLLEEKDGGALFIVFGLPDNITKEDFDNYSPSGDEWEEVEVVPFNYGYNKLVPLRKMYRTKDAMCYIFFTNQEEDKRNWIQFSSSVAKNLGLDDTSEKIINLDLQGAWDCQMARVKEWVDNTNERERQRTIKEINENIPTLLIEPLKRALEELKNKVKLAELEYLNRLEDCKRVEMNLFYRTHNQADSDEFATYLKDMGNVIPRVKVNSVEKFIYFKINTTLCFWDDDKIESILKYDYNYSSSDEKIKNIVEHILKRKCTLRIENDIVMNLRLNKVSKTGSGMFESMGWGVPNPHIYYYDCWGGNSKIISEHLLNGNMVAAMAQTIAALSSLTLGDSTVMNALFTKTLPIAYDDNLKCIERDGAEFSIAEYLEKYKEEFENESE